MSNLQFNSTITCEEILVVKIATMRENQKNYFKTKSHLYLVQAKIIERELDDFIDLNTKKLMPKNQPTLFDSEDTGYHGSMKNETMQEFWSVNING